MQEKINLETKVSNSW